MTLKRCSHMWGSAHIYAQPPSLKEHKNLFYIPSTKFFDIDNHWGIYDKDGLLIRASSYSRYEERSLIGQTAQVSSPEASAVTDDDYYLYCGPLVPHFGHFLLSSLSRLWPLITRNMDGVKLLFHCDHPIKAHIENHPYMRKFIEYMGIDGSRLCSFHETTLVRNLIIPGPAFLEQSHASTVFRELGHYIGRNTKQSTITVSDAPVYLSKTHLNCGVTSILNEIELEEKLRENGVNIIYPEEIDLSDQIEIFRSAPTVIGTTGSAFHMHIFSNKPPKMLTLNYQDTIHSNYVLLDRLNHANSTHVFPTSGVETTLRNGFNLTHKFANIDRIAEEILRFCDTHTSPQFFGDKLDNNLDEIKEIDASPNDDWIPGFSKLEGKILNLSGNSNNFTT